MAKFPKTLHVTREKEKDGVVWLHACEEGLDDLPAGRDVAVYQLVSVQVVEVRLVPKRSR